MGSKSYQAIASALKGAPDDRPCRVRHASDLGAALFRPAIRQSPPEGRYSPEKAGMAVVHSVSWRAGTTKMAARIALQVNAVVGIASTAVAGATMWLVLSRPAEVAIAMSDQQYGAVAAAVARQLGTWLQAILQFV
jgi:hypothetical protein